MQSGRCQETHLSGGRIREEVSSRWGQNGDEASASRKGNQLSLYTAPAGRNASLVKD